MIKGLVVAFAIFLSLHTFGIIGKASAKEPSVDIQQISTSCTLSPFSVASSLKTARLTQPGNGSDLFVPAVFTMAKEGNGSLEASIGVSVADPEVSSEVVSSPSILSQTPVVTVSPAEKTEVQGVSAEAPADGGLHAEVIFAMVNAHRVQMGLVPFQNDATIAQIAQSRTPELQGEMYGGGTMHAGFYNRHLPYWATENIISQQTEADAVNWWLHSPVHRSALEGNYTNASVACAGKNCSMIFTSFTPKE